MTAQNTRWGFGESSLPPEVRWSTTSDPESEDVTKNDTNSSTPTSDTNSVSGNASSMSNRAVATLSLTAVATSRSPESCKSMAAPPNTANHKKQRAEGKKMTPVKSSRTERPLDMRAMNIPTNGDHEIHHPQ